MRTTEPAIVEGGAGDRLVVAAVALLLTAAAAVILWAMRDADRQDRKLLIEATREPQVFEVSAGRYSETGPREELAAFYPQRLKVHRGDTIRFTNPTAEDPHSVTFGLAPDRSNQPRFGTGRDLPAINEPCVMDAPITVDTNECTGGTQADGFPAYGGQPFYNSGIIAPGGGQFDLRFSSDIPVGSYQFFCVIHPDQTGTVDVVADDEPTQRLDDVDASARELATRDATVLQDTNLEIERGRIGSWNTRVQAGAATARTSINLFLPAEITVDAGEPVTWTNTGSVPHVMVFGGYLTPTDAVRTPRTAPSGSLLPPGLFTTGPIGAAPYPRQQFTLRFGQPGTYSYLCTFHPGMTGQVTVL